MSALKSLRRMLSRRSGATENSKANVERDTRTEYAQTADDLPSSEATPPEPPHCTTCTCHTPSTQTPPDLGYLAFNFRGDRYGPAGIRARALETANAYITGIDTDGYKSPKALSIFSFYASRLDPDLGVLECPNATRPYTNEDWIAEAAAQTICDLGGCPTREAALEYLVGWPNRLFKTRLIAIDPAMTVASELKTSAANQPSSQGGVKGEYD